MHSRIGSLLLCGKSTYALSNRRILLPNRAVSSFLASPIPNREVIIHRFGFLSDCFSRQRFGFCGYAVEQFSDEEDNCHIEYHCASSPITNIYEWKQKLSILSENENDQEIVSRDESDRRDFEQISNLAKRMGLYCEVYGEVVVASKVPLPNYRPDLDDKRPQRQVVIPKVLQRRVESLLHEHCDRMQSQFGKHDDKATESKTSDLGEKIHPDDHPDSFLDETFMEKFLQRRSLHLRNMQRAWQESSEGKRMMEFRKTLPAFREKNRLLQAIAENQVTVISGETGCGKTTQLPQYILESEIESGRGAFCDIICTQPRRISAMAVSDRVSAERGEPLGESVGYKVRLEGMSGKHTNLLFCTSGILLRRLLSDRTLNGVTHVFVDEIHERGMNEDFLLIVLKDLLPRRKDLRLILMSATLNAELFSNFFGGAPTIHIPGFTYPVRAHFLEDVLEMTGYKLTSLNQIDDYGQDKLWKTQKQLAPRQKLNQITTLAEDALKNSNFDNYSPHVRDSLECWLPDSIGFNLIEAVLCHICRKERTGAVLVFMTGWDDIITLRDQLKAHPLLGDPNWVLLLTCHSSMTTSEQKLIFDKPPLNVRKVVLATNMAEASITINDVVFVVDCGKAKETTYDALNNTSCLLPSWISKASAQQRRGRAGRVQPGECFHLYPRCVFKAFADYQLPQLLRTPLNSICLQIKCLQIASIGEFLSASLQPPEPLAVQNAIDFLKLIGALDEFENLTNLGKYLSMLPVDPKIGKMLIMGAIFRCFNPVLTIAAGLSVKDPFILPQDKKDSAGRAKFLFSANNYSDHMALVRAYEGWKSAEREGAAYEFCWKNFLSAQTLQAIHSLRKQFSSILEDAGLIDSEASNNNKLSHDQSLVRAVICSGLFPGLASIVHSETSRLLKTMDDGEVLLHWSSVNSHYKTIPFPWLVFGEKVKVNSVHIRDTTGISDSIMILFGGPLSRGTKAGHLKMLSGSVDLFMDPDLADCYWNLKEEISALIQKKLEDPSIDIFKEGKYLMLAVQELLSRDYCEGRFVGRREIRRPENASNFARFSQFGTNPKNLLQSLLGRAGVMPPKYMTRLVNENEFRSMVKFNKVMRFVGNPRSSMKLAEKDAAAEALAWMIHTSDFGYTEMPDMTDKMFALLRAPSFRLKRYRPRRGHKHGSRGYGPNIKFN